MTQKLLLEVLERNKDKWFNARALSKKLKVNVSSVTNSLKQLRKYNMVDYRRKKYIHYRFLYRCKNEKKNT